MFKATPEATQERRVMVVFSGLVLLACSAVLQAQTAPQPSQPSAASTGPDPLAEIVVTARRVAETKQTVPVSITAIDAPTLVARGIDTVSDLQKLTPGVILNGSGLTDNTTFQIRGQGKVSIGAGLPSVITYVNEVPLPSWGSSPPTFDVSNVQILKGPQGTSFGRNTTGGAVLVYTAPATYAFEGYAQVQGGNHDDHEFQGAVNIPIVTDKLAIRLATDIERRNGYTHNVQTGQNIDDKHTDAFRVSVLMQPVDTFSNVLVFDYLHHHDSAGGEFAFDDLDPALVGAAIAQQAALGARTVETPHVSYNRNVFWGASDTATLLLSGVTVKNIFGYRSTNTKNGGDLSGVPVLPLPDLGGGYPPAEAQLAALGYINGQPGEILSGQAQRKDVQASDELQFVGAALNDKLTWILGGFYLRDKPSGADSNILDSYHPYPPTPAQSAYINTFLGGVWPFSTLADTLSTDESKSTFFTGTYNLGGLAPVLGGYTINAGYRYTWDKEGVCANGRAVISLATSQPLLPPYPSLAACQADPTSFSSSATSSAPTYTLGLDKKVSDDLFVYFTTRTGYRAGGINTPAMASSLAQFQDFRPQKVTDYEIGAHTKWQAGGLAGRFNIAVYRDSYSDLQLQATGFLPTSVIGGVPLGANAPSNESLSLNAGKAVFEGVEFDGTVVPLQGLTLSYGAAYIDARYTSLAVPAIVLPFFQAQNFSGSPRWSYQGSVQYTLPIHPGIGGDIVANGDFYHIAKQYQGFALLPAYALADFSASWQQVAGQQLDLTAFVDNAFNKTYVNNVSLNAPGVGVYSGSYGPPRMYGLRLRYRFGGN